MRKATIFLSDLHVGDPDFFRADVLGVTGEQLFAVFADWLALMVNKRYEVHTVNVGDGIDCVPYLAEALRHQAHIIDELHSIGNVAGCRHTWLAGNHDKRLIDCSLLRYGHDCGKYCDGTVWAEHGHRLDKAWRDKGILSTWLGDHIIKRGRQLEKRWPLFDETLLRAGRVLMPKGHDGVSDEKQVEAACAMHKANAKLIKFVFGHTHRALYVRMASDESIIAVVNCHSWVPSPSSHPEGWYERGQVAPFVYWAERDLYMMVTPNGMHRVAGSDRTPASLMEDLHIAA